MSGSGSGRSGLIGRRRRALPLRTQAERRGGRAAAVAAGGCCVPSRRGSSGQRCRLLSRGVFHLHRRLRCRWL